MHPSPTPTLADIARPVQSAQLILQSWNSDLRAVIVALELALLAAKEMLKRIDDK